MRGFVEDGICVPNPFGEALLVRDIRFNQPCVRRDVLPMVCREIITDGYCRAIGESIGEIAADKAPTLEKSSVEREMIGHDCTLLTAYQTISENRAAGIAFISCGFSRCNRWIVGRLSVLGQCVPVEESDYVGGTGGWMIVALMKRIECF